MDHPTISVSGSIFSERAVTAGLETANSGFIETRINIDVRGDRFSFQGVTTGATPTNDQMKSFFNLTNVPLGLTPSYNYVNDRQVVLSLTGQALSHSGIDDVDDMELTALAGAFKSGFGSNVIKDLSVDFIEVATIRADTNTFVESGDNDGSITNKATFTISGGAKLKTVERSFAYGFLLSLPNALRDDIQINGVTIDVDNALHGADLRKGVIDFINSSGQGTLTDDGRIYAKAVDNNILLLKDSVAPVRLTMEGANSNLNRHNNLERRDTTTRLIDPTLNLNDNTHINVIPPATGIQNLVAQFKALNPSQIEMAMTSNAISHSSAENTTKNFTVQIRQNIFDGTPPITDPTPADTTMGNFTMHFAYIDGSRVTSTPNAFNESNQDDGSVDTTLTLNFDNADIVGIIPSNRITDYITTHNIPSNLSAAYSVLNPSQIEMRLINQAVSHEPQRDDINNISLEFKQSLFVANNKIDNLEDVGLRFIKKGELEAFPKIFLEGKANSGVIDNTMTITLSNDQFYGTIGNAVRAGAITAYNIPAHLDPTYTLIDETSIRVTLLRSADAHTNRDDIDNIRFEFDSSLMRSGIKPDSITGVSVNFGDKITLGVNRRDFNEGVLLDNGSIANPVTLTITGGGELDFTQKRFDFGSRIDQDTIYAILSATNKTLRIGAERKNIPIQPNLYYKRDVSFINHIASAINNGWNGTRLANGDTIYASVVHEGGRHSIILLKENSNGNSDAIPFETGGSTNLYANDNNLSPNLKNIKMPINNTLLMNNIQYENVPLGLTPKFNAINTKNIEVVLEGVAQNHDIVDKVVDMKVSLNSEIVRGALFVEPIDDLTVNFIEKKELEDGQYFKEANSDDGSMADRLVVDLGSALRAGITANELSQQITVLNLPVGLQPSYSMVGATQISIQLSGNARKHRDPNDDTNLTFAFEKEIFDSNRITTIYKTRVDFVTPAQVSAVPDSFVEGADNDGSISNRMTLNVRHDGIQSALNDIDLAGLITINNLPRGLNPSYHKVNNSTIEVDLGNNAVQHTRARSINSLEFQFDNALFEDNVPVDRVENIKVTFLDPVIITPNATTFEESNNNDGTINTTISLSTRQGGGITNAIATGAIIPTNLYSVSHLPANLSVKLTKINDNDIAVNLVGQAQNHRISDNVNNLQISLLQDVFSIQSTSSPLNFSINFVERATLSANTSFVESETVAGAIANTVTITIGNDRITPAVTNITPLINITSPANHLTVLDGLRERYTKLNASQIEVSFEGTRAANNHISPTHDNTLEFTLRQGLLEKDSLDERINIALDFINRANITIAGNRAFDEVAVNDGGIDDGDRVRLDIAHASLAQREVGFIFTGRMGNITTSAGRGGTLEINGTPIVVPNAGYTATQLAQAINNSGAGLRLRDSQEQLFAKVDPTDPNALFFYKQTGGRINMVHTLTGGAVARYNINDDNTILDSRMSVIDDIALQRLISATNIPTGLQASFFALSDSQVEVRLDGKALNHDSIDNINNLNFAFNSLVFTDGISVDSADKAEIRFVDNLQAFVIHGFKESVKNDGSIATEAIIRLPSGGLNTKSAYNQGTHLTLELPPGITNADVTYQALNSTDMQISIAGRVTGVTEKRHSRTLDLSFANNFVTGGVIKALKVPLDFVEEPTLTFSSKVFTEAKTNNGSIPHKSTITITNGDKIVGEVAALSTALNLPYDLNANFTKINDSQIEFSLDGNAALHSSAKNLNNIAIRFDGGLFESGVQPRDITDFSLRFVDPPTVTHTGSFKENGLLQGSIDDNHRTTLTLNGDTLKNTGNITNLIGLENLPQGVLHVANAINSSQIEISLRGTVLSHHVVDSLRDITLNFNDRFIFTNEIAPESIRDLSLIFVEPNAVTLYGKFKEAINNNGTIENKVTLYNDDDRFTNITDDRLGSYIEIVDLPTALTPSFSRVDDKTITVALNGQASNHRLSDSVDNLQIRFTNTRLFDNGIIGSSVRAQIEFFDLSSVVAMGEFREIGNSGRYSGRVLVQIDGDRFDTTASIARNDIQLGNLPRGLSVDARFISTNAMEISLNGETTTHTVADNRDLEIIFANPNLFTSRIAPNNIQGIRLINNDPTQMVVNGSFIENDQDIGIIDNRITLTVSDDQFDNRANLENVVTVTNLPRGLEPSFNLIDAHNMAVELKGRARLSHHRDSSINFSFSDGLFLSRMPADNLTVSLDFIKKPYLNVKGSFIESLQDDGKMRQAITITLSNNSFVNNPSFNDLITVGNLPDGLTPSYSLINGTNLQVKLEGEAISHQEEDSIANLSFEMRKEIFVDGIDSAIGDIPVTFLDPPTVSLTGSFLESVLDDGSMPAKLNITVVDDTIQNVDLNSYITVTGLPSGLQADFKRAGRNQLVFSLNGRAENHSDTDNTTIDLQFDPLVFASGRKTVPIEDVSLVYRNRPVFESNNIVFEENFEQPGAIFNKVTLTLSGDDFIVGANPYAFINVKNLPLGLRIEFEAQGDNLIVSLEGEAIRHTSADSVSNLSIEFKDGLFLGGVKPDGVELSIDYKDTGTFIKAGSFTEIASNDGEVSGEVVLSLIGDTLNNINPNNYIDVTNLPAGLKARFEIRDESNMVMTLTGNAILHDNENDVRNLQLDFKSELFKSGTKASKVKFIGIDFKDPTSMESTGLLLESAANTGAITSVVTLTPKSDYFVTDANPNTLITAQNIPAGLTPDFVMLNTKTIIMRLLGEAQKHSVLDNSVVDLEFDGALFQNGIQPEGISVNVVFDSAKPAVVSFDRSFKEDIQNDGSIPTDVMLSITNDQLGKYHTMKQSFVVENIYDTIVQNSGITNMTVQGATVEVNSDLAPEQLLDSIAETINNSGDGTSYDKADGTTGKLYAKTALDVNSVKYLVLLSDDDRATLNVNGNAGEAVLNPYLNPGETGYEEQQALIGDRLQNMVVDRRMPLEYFLDRYIKALGVPADLTVKYSKIDDNRILVKLLGQAKLHNEQDSHDIIFEFDKNMFEKQLKPKNVIIPIDYQNPQIVISGSFTERGINDGSVTGVMRITLYGGEFVEGINYKDYMQFNNIPSGLTPVVTKESNNILSVKLDGQATEHGYTDSINNVTVILNDNLITTPAPLKTDDNIGIKFIDPYDAVTQVGGPGEYGGYLTFISPQSKNIIISTGGLDVGFGGHEHQTFTTLSKSIRGDFDSDNLYGIGVRRSPEVLHHDNSFGIGLTSMEGAFLVMDSVDTAAKDLQRIRTKIASKTTQIKESIKRMEVTKSNIESAQSNLAEVDFAEETRAFNKANILAKSGDFAMSQASKMNRKSILTLVEGSKWGR